MFNVLSDIRGFSSGKLRKVQTKVLTSDGRQLVESRDSRGRIISKETGKIGPPYVPDVKPDLEVGEVLPGLLLGSQDAAQDLPTLTKHYISHILNLAPGIDNPLADQYVTKTVTLLDLPETNIRPVFDECFDFIEDARRRGGNVLVHCNAGISRSATIVIAYIMKSQGRRFEQAFDMVKSKRPIKPNDGFLRQLKSYNEELFTFPPKEEKAPAPSVKKQETKVQTVVVPIVVPETKNANADEELGSDEEYTEEEYTDEEA